MNAWILENITLIDDWFPWKKNYPLSLEISLSARELPQGLVFTISFKNMHIDPDRVHLLTAHVHTLHQGIWSPSNLWAEFMNSIFVHVLYLGMCKNTYLGHNRVAVLDISLFPPHNVLGHVSPAYLQTRITFQRTWGQTLPELRNWQLQAPGRGLWLHGMVPELDAGR